MYLLIISGVSASSHRARERPRGNDDPHVEYAHTRSSTCGSLSGSSAMSLAHCESPKIHSLEESRSQASSIALHQYPYQR
jgi:hypothetical protein